MKRCVETLHRIQNLIYFSIVYSQKLVCGSDSVRVMMLFFGTFLVDELVYRLGFRLVKNIYFGYLKENFSKCRRTTFGNMPGGYIKLSRLVRRSIKSCKSCNCSSVSEPSGVADLSNELWTIHFSNTKYGHNGIIFRQRRSNSIHLRSDRKSRFQYCVQLGNNLCHNQFYTLV